MSWTRFGLCLGPTWALAGTDGSAGGRLGSLARAAEDAAFDALWFPPPADAGGLDPFVLAAAVAPLTSTIRLGCLDYPLDGRAPSMLAKAVASLDVISAGRASVGVDTGPAGTSGWAELTDALELLAAMLRTDAPTIDEGSSTVHEAWNEPRIRHTGDAGRGGPPIVVHLAAGVETDVRLAEAIGRLEIGLAVAAGAGAGETLRGRTSCLVGVVPVVEELPAPAVAAAARTLAAGYDAVVLDLAGPLCTPALVTALGEGLARLAE